MKPENKWIRTEDRLPRNGQIVLVFFKNSYGRNRICKAEEYRRRIIMYGNQNWKTPGEFFKKIDREFGLQFDAACTIHDRLCSDGFFYPKQNALEQDWRDIPQLRIWCNPPFKVMQPWVDKCVEFTQGRLGTVAVLLAPLSCAPWIQTCYQHAVEIRDIYPRIQFDLPYSSKPIRKSSNAKDNILVVFRGGHVGNCTRFWWRWK